MPLFLTHYYCSALLLLSFPLISHFFSFFRQNLIQPSYSQDTNTTMAATHSNPRTVEEIFKDFSARRNAVIRALTTGPFLLLSLLYIIHTRICSGNCSTSVGLVNFSNLFFFLFSLTQMLTNFTPTAIPVSNHFLHCVCGFFICIMNYTFVSKM